MGFTSTLAALAFACTTLSASMSGLGSALGSTPSFVPVRTLPLSALNFPDPTSVSSNSSVADIECEEEGFVVT